MADDDDARDERLGRAARGRAPRRGHPPPAGQHRDALDGGTGRDPFRRARGGRLVAAAVGRGDPGGRARLPRAPRRRRHRAEREPAASAGHHRAGRAEAPTRWRRPRRRTVRGLQRRLRDAPISRTRRPRPAWTRRRRRPRGRRQPRPPPHARSPVGVQRTPRRDQAAERPASLVGAAAGAALRGPAPRRHDRRDRHRALRRPRRDRRGDRRLPTAPRRSTRWSPHPCEVRPLD